jgi:hypothetical protein
MATYYGGKSIKSVEYVDEEVGIGNLLTVGGDEIAEVYVHHLSASSSGTTGSNVFITLPGSNSSIFVESIDSIVSRSGSTGITRISPPHFNNPITLYSGQRIRHTGSGLGRLKALVIRYHAP